MATATALLLKSLQSWFNTHTVSVGPRVSLSSSHGALRGQTLRVCTVRPPEPSRARSSSVWRPAPCWEPPPSLSSCAWPPPRVSDTARPLRSSGGCLPGRRPRRSCQVCPWGSLRSEREKTVLEHGACALPIIQISKASTEPSSKQLVQPTAWILVHGLILLLQYTCTCTVPPHQVFSSCVHFCRWSFIQREQAEPRERSFTDVFFTDKFMSCVSDYEICPDMMSVWAKWWNPWSMSSDHLFTSTERLWVSHSKRPVGASDNRTMSILSASIVPPFNTRWCYSPMISNILITLRFSLYFEPYFVFGRNNLLDRRDESHWVKRSLLYTSILKSTTSNITVII